MHRCLRFLFVFVLVVLLPLRGWAGNVMAIEMTTNMAMKIAADMSVNMVTTPVLDLAASALNPESGAVNPEQTPLPASQTLAPVAVFVPMALPMPADCAMHSQPAADVVAGDAVTHCSSCDTCELCLAVTSVAKVQWSASRALQHSSPPAFDMRFSSAVKASDLKPPIS